MAVRRDVLSVAFLIVLCGYLFFFQLGKLALTDPDETFYAQTAKEMVALNDWVTPHLYGQPQFEKPVLFYWLVELSYRIFGVSEFAARLPSPIFALIGVIAFYFLGRLLFGERAGLLAAVILATNVEYVILSRACITDMVLTTFLLLTALFFFYGYLQQKNYCYLLSAAALGLATLTKGPVAVMVFAATVCIYLLMARDLKRLVKMPLAAMVLVFIAVVAPWYAAIYKLHGKAFIDGFFGLHNVNRFLQAEHKIGSQVYYNIPILLGGFFPWSVFLPFGLWHAIRKLRLRQPLVSGEKRGLLFLLVWFVVIFGFFTASSTKLPTYIFPCFISVAAIVAVLLDDFLRPGTARSVTAGTKASYYVLTAIMLLGWLGGAIYAKLDYPSIMAGVIVASLALVFGMVLSLMAFIRKKFMAAILFIPYALALFLYPTSVLILPEVERLETSKAVAQKLLKVMRPEERLGSESNYLAGLAFYTGKYPVDLDKHHIQIKFMNSKERIWAVLKEKNHGHLYNAEITKVYIKPSYMIYKAGKRAVVTNEMPADGAYILKREALQ